MKFTSISYTYLNTSDLSDSITNNTYLISVEENIFLLAYIYSSNTGISSSILCLSQNELLTYLWYLNLGYTLRGLGVIQKFNDDDNDD